jgi:hypothetical protein
MEMVQWLQHMQILNEENWTQKLLLEYITQENEILRQRRRDQLDLKGLGIVRNSR